MKLKLLVVDDHSVVRDGLAAILNLQKDFAVIGQADDGRSAIQLADALSPDVIIMDLMMPVMNGSDATKEIVSRHPGMKILILTTYGTSSLLTSAFDNGATGAIAKTCPKEELFSAIRNVCSGQKVISDEIKQFLNEEADSESLSLRQMQMLSSLSRGLTNRDIAEEFGLSYGVVKFHLKELFRKIGASSRTEAVAIAMRKHLLKI